MATLKVRVFVLPEGKLQVFVDNGTDEQAQEATKQILAKMQANGMKLESIGEIELHRTGSSDHVHIVESEEQRHEH